MTPAQIVLRGVNTWFADFHALWDIDLEIGTGEKVVICGPSGSGKSTLIRCLNGLESHRSGSIVVDGVEITADPASIHAVRRRVGMVFQQSNLFPHLTVLENCTLAPVRVRKMSRPDAEKIALHHLHRMRVADQAHKYPRALSGGQQQRVAIARALTMAPKILVFDEPTSALDPEMAGEVLDAIVELADEGNTIVCVTHEMAFARDLADRVIFMNGGRIVESPDAAAFFDQARRERPRIFAGSQAFTRPA